MSRREEITVQSRGEKKASLFPFSSPRSRFRAIELELKLVLLTGDLFFLFFSIFLGLEFRGFLQRLFPSLPPFVLKEHLSFFQQNIWLFLPVPLALLWQRLYRRLPFWEELRRLWLALFEGFVLIYALVSLAKLGEQASRLTILFSLFISFFLFPFGRFLLKRWLFSFKRYRLPALVCPAGEEAAYLVRALEREKTFGYEVLGFLDDRPALYGRTFAGKKVFGPLRQAGKFARLRGVDAIFLLQNGAPFPRLEELYAYLQRNVGEVFLVPSFTGLGLLNAELAFFFARRLVFIRIINPLSSYFARFLKRFFDLVLASLLFILALPIMGIIALAIKLDSEGPIFFTHERVGRGGRTFRIYKFRTMHQNAEERLSLYLAQDPEKRRKWHIYRKLDDDPRVTRVGRILRRFSLDELPQLVNVLKGDMSLVGPRPAMAEELKTYYAGKVHFYLAVRPGLTGLWQVSGRNRLSFEERVRLDVWYVQNWSLWLDLVILLKTIPAVLRCEGSF